MPRLSGTDMPLGPFTLSYNARTDRTRVRTGMRGYRVKEGKKKRECC